MSVDLPVSYPGPSVHPAAAVALVLLAALAFTVHAVRTRTRGRTRTPAAVVFTAVSAVACTAYSADTSWRFAKHQLEMTEFAERAAFFAAGELVLFSCALMARHNKLNIGSPGAPGMLVWLITGVQVFAAYAEAGFVGGTVRAIVGPVFAALLWHLAMGIELRHAKPGAASQSLAAALAREMRERLKSYLGLATRDRSAEDMLRDRATRRAVALAARLAANPPSRAWRRGRLERSLALAVARSGAGTDEARRETLLALLAARRHASALATVDLPSPWTGAPVPASAGAPPPPKKPAGTGAPSASDAVLAARARKQFATALAAGQLPSVRQLRRTLNLGQPRAQRVLTLLNGSTKP